MSHTPLAPTLGLLAILVFMTPAHAWSSGEIEVDAFVRGSMEAAEIVLTVHNVSNTPINELRVELWKPGKRVAASGKITLTVGQSTVVRFSTDRPAQAYLLVRALSGNAHYEVAVPVPDIRAPVASGGLGIPIIVVTSVLSLASAVIGGILAHITTARRERHRMRFDALKSDTDRYAPAYREFLDYWKKSISASHLEAGYRALSSKARVPSDIQKQYERTLRTLQSSSAKPAEKQVAAEQLFRAVDDLTGTQPDPDQ